MTESQYISELTKKKFHDLTKEEKLILWKQFADGHKRLLQPGLTKEQREATIKKMNQVAEFVALLFTVKDGANNRKEHSWMAHRYPELDI